MQLVDQGRELLEGDSIIGRLWRAKFIRYSMISAICVVGSVIIQSALLYALFRLDISFLGDETKAGTANAVATIVLTPVSFVLNRRWAWGETGKSHVFKQHLPFWILTLAGFLLSLLTVHYADAWVAGRGWSHDQRTLFANVANVAAFGILWVVKYVVINSFLFVQHKQHPEIPESTPGEPSGEAPPYTMEPLPHAARRDEARIDRHQPVGVDQQSA